MPKPEELLLAMNRPSWTSSDMPGTSKSNANDDNNKTAWKPVNGDKEKWWKLHLEAAYSIEVIQIELPEENKDYSFKIEVSTDDVNWKEIPTGQPQTNPDRIRTFRGEFGDNIAFIRITFTSDEAGLSEVKVGGKS